ncbi:MAG: hypothetical protein WCP57_00145 [Bacteroidota bacterium]
MKKFFVGVGFSLVLFLVACTPTYTVDLKIRNNTTDTIIIEYISKGKTTSTKKTLQPGDQFSISKYDREGIDLEWNTVWKYKILNVQTSNAIKSWKDYNIAGAWDMENSRYRTKGTLILENTDFLADIK